MLQEAILREYVQRMHSFRNAASINPLWCGVVWMCSQVWDAFFWKSIICAKVNTRYDKAAKDVIVLGGAEGLVCDSKERTPTHVSLVAATSGVDTQENKCKQQTRVVSVCCQMHIRQTNTSGGKSQKSKDKRKEKNQYKDPVLQRALLYVSVGRDREQGCRVVRKERLCVDVCYVLCCVVRL